MRSILIAQKAIEVYHKERKKSSKIAKRSIKINIQPILKYLVKTCTSYEYFECSNSVGANIKMQISKYKKIGKMFKNIET